MPGNQYKAANHHPSYPQIKSSKQQGRSKGGCILAEEPLRYTPPWPSVQGWKVGISSHGALTHPEADQWQSPMAGVEVAWKLFSGRIRR